MAKPSFCLHCQEIQMHNSSGQCLYCNKRSIKQDFENWKSDKSIEGQIKDLYFMIKEKEDKTVSF